MYRLLREAGETGDRRRQATHPPKVKPELVAHAPNRVWSWDITKLAGPAKWTYYYLYVIIDIYSRYVPGWLLAHREDAKLAEQLLGDSCFRQDIAHGQLSIHADRGCSMASKTVAFLLADLGVTKSHSRPHVSNDNPFSEAHFKTLKYRPDFPDRFDSIEHARAHVRDFFGWYNHGHRHSGVALMSPADVHYGRAAAITAARGQVLDAAYAAHPERFGSPTGTGVGAVGYGPSLAAVMSWGSGICRLRARRPGWCGTSGSGAVASAGARGARPIPRSRHGRRGPIGRAVRRPAGWVRTACRSRRWRGRSGWAGRR